MLDVDLPIWEGLLQLAAAAMCGGALGWVRERHGITTAATIWVCGGIGFPAAAAIT